MPEQLGQAFVEEAQVLQVPARPVATPGHRQRLAGGQRGSKHEYKRTSGATGCAQARLIHERERGGAHELPRDTTDKGNGLSWGPGPTNPWARLGMVCFTDSEMSLNFPAAPLLAWRHPRSTGVKEGTLLLV